MNFITNSGFKKISKDKYLYYKSCYSQIAYIISEADKKEIEKLVLKLLGKMPLIIIPMLVFARLSILLSIFISSIYTWHVTRQMITQLNVILNTKKTISVKPIGFFTNMRSFAESMSIKEIIREFRYTPVFLFVMYICIFRLSNVNPIAKYLIFILTMTVILFLIGIFYFCIMNMLKNKS